MIAEYIVFNTGRTTNPFYDYSNEEVKDMMQRDCGSCRHKKDGICTYFGEAIEDAYLVDCPCKVEAST